MNTLSSLEQDALTEIFNIGVGVAAAALFEMTGEHVPVSVPVVELTRQRAAVRHFLDREQRQLCAIRQTYSGEFSAVAVLMFPEESRLHLVRMMVGNDFPEADLGDVAQDAMGELGNIMLHAVISTLASSLALRLEGTLPEVSLVNADAVFTRRTDVPDPVDDDAPVLALMIEFQLSAHRADGYLAFLLDAASSQVLLQRLTAHIGAVPG